MWGEGFLSVLTNCTFSLFFSLFFSTDPGHVQGNTGSGKLGKGEKRKAIMKKGEATVKAREMRKRTNRNEREEEEKLMDDDARRQRIGRMADLPLRLLFCFP